jgi:flagellar motility protein MotE (MotC chaperone)
MTNTSKAPRGRNADVRILPAVIAVGAILFTLKAGGLAFGARAAETEAPAQTQAQTEPSGATATAPGAAPAALAPAAPAPAQNAAAPSGPKTLPGGKADPLAAISAALPTQPGKSLIAQNEAASPANSSDPSQTAISAAEMDVLTSLSERRDVLDQRQRELDLRANVITAAEKRVDDKIAQLKTLQATIEKLLGQRDQKETEQLDGLVRVYSAMKPKDAARIFASLDDEVRIGVAGRMKADTMAGIMSSLPAEVAQKLTVQLASRLKMSPEALSAAAAAAAQPAPATAPPPPAARPNGG